MNYTMKKSILFLFFALLPFIVVVAQNKEQELIGHAVKRLNQAMIDGDRAVLDELTSSNLSYGHSSWLIEDKAAFIAAILNGTSGFISINLSEQTISISNDVALVRHKFSADTDNKGQAPGHINLGVLQVWQKEKGKWMLLARQATRLQ